MLHFLLFGKQRMHNKRCIFCLPPAEVTGAFFKQAISARSANNLKTKAISFLRLQVMKIMGLSNAVHWFAWFISSFMQLQVSVMTIALILKFGHVLGKSNFLIIWLFFTVYAAATIMFW